jgi:hypothetical protein
LAAAEGFTEVRMSSVSAHRRPPAACTVITRNHLSYARVLAESFARHFPGGRFYLLVADGLPDGVEAGAGMGLVRAAELLLPYFTELCFKYNAMELCAALKPSILRTVLELYREEEVVFFDSDILIARPLDEMTEALCSADIVFTPHNLDPIPQDGQMPNEPYILLAGTYNSGFVALRKSEQAKKFLRWWEDRLRDGCRLNVSQGFMLDQKWIELVPSYFPATVILHDPTYNVAYWNGHSRPIERRGDQYFVNGRPLAFYHFSGYNPEKPQVLSKYQSRVEVKQGSGLADLLALYGELQRKHGSAVTSQWGYRYATFNNGLVILPVLRQLYLNLNDEAKRQFGNPFDVGRPDSFFNWAIRPRPETNLSPFLEEIYRLRHDVASAFPEMGGKHRSAFLAWARTNGPREIGYDPKVMGIDALAAVAQVRVGR